MSWVKRSLLVMKILIINKQKLKIFLGKELHADTQKSQFKSSASFFSIQAYLSSAQR